MASASHPNCKRRHTDWQPSDEEWRCPECGIGYTFLDGDDCGFVIDDSVNEACDALHVDDEVRCYRCGYSAVASQWVKDAGH